VETKDALKQVKQKEFKLAPKIIKNQKVNAVKMQRYAN